MTTYEHTVLVHRGALSEDVQAMLATLGADGWAIVSAYAVGGETSTLAVHHYVLSRTIDPPSDAASNEAAKINMPAPLPKNRGRGR